MVFFILWSSIFVSTPTSIGASLDEEREVEGVAVGYYSARISWATDEPATSQVDYGISSDIYEYSTPENEALVTDHEITLAGLEPATTYHYRIRSKDAFGNEGVSQEFTFKTMDLSIADTRAPEISNIKVASSAGLREDPTYISDDEAELIIAAGPAGPPVIESAPQVEVTQSAGQLTKHEEPVEKTLVQKGGLLLPRGTWQFEPSLTYAHTSANRIVISGFTVLPVLIIGSISVDSVKRDIMIQTNTLRYGLFNDVQVEVKVPYRYQYERITTADNIETADDLSGLGDIEAGLYHQFAFEKGWVPDMIAGVSVKSDTADKSPYDNPGDIGLGTGHWAAKASLVWVKSSDPAIIYGGLNYTWNMEDDIDNYGKVDPGDTLGYSFGMTFALNYQVALNLGMEQSITEKMKIEDTAVNGSFTNVASVKYGLVWSINKNFSCDVSASHGLTTDSPDLVLEVRFPYTF